MSAEKRPKRKIRFLFRAPEKTYQVFIAGEFNNWDIFCHPMKRQSADLWEVVIPLAPGKYQYKFLIDNSRWETDPNAESVPNAYGSFNSIIEVK